MLWDSMWPLTTVGYFGQLPNCNPMSPGTYKVSTFVFKVLPIYIYKSKRINQYVYIYIYIYLYVYIYVYIYIYIYICIFICTLGPKYILHGYIGPLGQALPTRLEQTAQLWNFDAGARTSTDHEVGTDKIVGLEL